MQEAEGALADENQLVSEMTPEQLQCLDLITSSRDVMLQEFEEKFNELKEDIGQVKVIWIFLNFSFVPSFKGFVLRKVWEWGGVKGN